MNLLYYFSALKKSLYFEQCQTHVKVARKRYKKHSYIVVPSFPRGIHSKNPSKCLKLW